jgi:DNA-binding LacI/PurR family transcriptional regulator
MISSKGLAKLCGVSRGTVDRALHGRGRVSHETKARILTTAQEYGYGPNPVMHEIMRGTSRIVGAVVPEARDGWCMTIVKQVSAKLRRKSFKLFTAFAANEAEFYDCLQEFAFRRVHVVLFLPPVPKVTISRKLIGDTDLISLAQRYDDASIQSMIPDTFRAGLDAIDYLYEKGHRRILFVNYDHHLTTFQEKARGYEEAMKRRGLPAFTFLTHLSEDCPDILGSLNEGELLSLIRERGITALFCQNEWLALSVMTVCERNGMNIPRDISVMGGSSCPLSQAMYPHITTMLFPFNSVTTAVVERILTGGEVQPRMAPFGLHEGSTVAEVQIS